MITEGTELNESLESNIDLAKPLNSELVRNVEEAKVVNNNLESSNQEATTKNRELQASLEETKKYIAGLDGSQNIPQIRLDITELQNGLKSNQALEYSGSSISANDTLEGRTEGMKIKGKTLRNLVKISTFYGAGTATRIEEKTSTSYKITNTKNEQYLSMVVMMPSELIKPSTEYTVMFKCESNLTDSISLSFKSESSYGEQLKDIQNKNGFNIINIASPNKEVTDIVIGNHRSVKLSEFIKIEEVIVLEGNWTNKSIPAYFEGIKSFGEAEQEGDKYKISSSSKNDNFLQGLRRVLIDIGTGEETPSDIYFSSDFVENSLVTYYKTVFDDEYILTNVFYYDENKKYINSQLNITGLSSFNRDKNGKFIRLVGRRNDKGTNVDLSNIKIVVGSKKYTEYFNGRIDKKDILIKEPLRSIGDIQDVMYEDIGQVKIDRVVGEYTFTGDENITRRPYAVEDETIGFGIFKNEIPFKVGGVGLCNNFKLIKSPDVFWNQDDGKSFTITDFIQFRVPKTELETQDIEGFKAWLRANPTTVYYQLATPVTEIVEGIDIDLDTFQDKTYFNILNSLPGTLDFKVPSNIGSSLQNLAKEVNEIWDVINNLLVPGLIDTKKTLALKTIKNNLK